MTRTRSVFLLSFMLAQVADAFSTNAALSHGAWEANPLMSWAQDALGTAWVIPKLGLTIIALWAMTRFKKTWHVAVVAVVCAVPAVGNLFLWNN